jgi:opacity protein-like surface antigen
MKKQALAMAVTMALSAPVCAQQSGVAWYAGAGLGYDKLSNDLQNLPGGIPTSSYSDEDIGYGIFGGVKNYVGNWFYGGELGLSGSNAKSVGLSDGFTREGELEVNYDLSLSARGGYQIVQNIYLTGRIGYVNTDFDYRALIGGTPFDTGSESLSGWRAGLGFEWFVSPNISLSLEYAHTEYSGDIITMPDSTISMQFIGFSDVSRDAFTIGAAYQF